MKKLLLLAILPFGIFAGEAQALTHTPQFLRDMHQILSNNYVSMGQTNPYPTFESYVKTYCGTSRAMNVINNKQYDDCVWFYTTHTNYHRGYAIAR